ncbi:hypothetical protein Avbf_18390 [Armadillidium vulgare]|nr:hypothetical protein Avbf_18390 [Armadillidium vulgare]
MQEAFVIHVQNPVDVPVTISKKQEKLSHMSLSMQPFTLFHTILMKYQIRLSINITTTLFNIEKNL